MSGGVTKEVTAEVRARASILDVIAESVVLKRAGKEYKGCCPFHNEKSPSFHVNPEKGIFKCFGCQVGGDVFVFVQKSRGLDFLDSVRYLAHKYGVPLVESEQDREAYSKKSHIKTIYEQACVFYQKLLADPQEGAFARDYLAKRGITDETIAKFRLGFAPAGWDGLISFLSTSSQVTTSILAEAGLVREKQGGGSFYDLFRNRLMVPICNSEGDVIAFGGRALAADDQVKYINSPETPIYTKGNNLFAFHHAKAAIKENDSVIVVEGYFDAIMPHQCGFTNTVASLGTALTEAQAKLLIRYTESKRVYLSFDADKAGAAAVERGVEMLGTVAEGIGVDLRVLRVPGGKDPDECLRQPDGPEIFRRAIDRAPVLIEYQLDTAVDGINLGTHTGRIEAASKVVPILSRLKNAIARGEYIRQSSSRLKIGEEELLHEVRTYRRDHKLDRGDQRYSDRFSGEGLGYSPGGYQNKGPGGYQKGSGGYQNKGSGGFQSKGSGDFRSGGGGGSDRTGSGGKNFQGKGYQNKSGGRFEPQEAGHRPSAFPQREPRASKVPSGVTDAERRLLVLYLTSRDDYDRISAALADETLLTPAHQRIKEELEGIGGNFNTMEDLQYQLMDRVATDEEVAALLTEIILLVDETKKQKAPWTVLLTECISRILKERINDLNVSFRKLLATAEDDSVAITIQSKMLELQKVTNQFQTAKTMEELKSVRGEIDALDSNASAISRKAVPTGNFSSSQGVRDSEVATLNSSNEHSDQPHSNKGHSDKEISNKEHSDKPHSNKEYSDKQHSDKEYSETRLPNLISVEDRELELAVPEFEEAGFDEDDEDDGAPVIDPSLN